MKINSAIPIRGLRILTYSFLPLQSFSSIRLPASALEEALAATEVAAAPPRPFPSEERLEAAKAFTESIEADAVELAKQSALSTDAFASLLAHREPASGDSCEGSLSGLVKCQRCNKVMFSSVKAHHATICKIRQAVAAARNSAGGAGAGTGAGPAPSDSDWQPPSFDTGTNGNGKGKKRKQQQSYDNNNPFLPPPISKTRFSRDSSHRSGSLPSQQAPPPINTTTTGDRYQYDSSMQPPLSPMLAAAASLRQGRSVPNRERRRQLAYLPNQDLDEPLILNRSPVRGSIRPTSAGPIPLRLASQNSEELSTRTGSGPVAAAVPVPPQQQQQQQQGARVLSPQQAQQMYQHIQQLRAAQQAAGGVGQQQQRYVALPPQLSQQFAAQLQYAQQIRQQQLQQQQQQQAQGGRGPGAPVLQGVASGGTNVSGGGGGATFIPINGIMHQAFNTTNTTAAAAGGGPVPAVVPAGMYRQFVPSSLGSGFVPVQQHPTVPQ
jgi:hypothetical protein